MSYKVGDEVHIEDDDATAGSKEGVVRWVLLISLLAAVVILSAIWITGAFVTDDTPEPAAAVGADDVPAAVAPAGDESLGDTDGLLTEEAAPELDEEVVGGDLAE